MDRYFSEGWNKKLSRKNFLEFCTVAAATMGLPSSVAELFAQNLDKKDARPTAVWLHLQECTGCSETLLRSTHPDVVELIFDLVSLDYHETIMAASGHQAELSLKNANAQKHILIVEGSIPLKDNGNYCKIGGKTALESLKESAKNAIAIIAMGSCASWGGVQSTFPLLTEATGVSDIIKDVPVINLPGCPPNPYNFLSTVIYFLTYNKLPQLDSKSRPMFAYGKTLHEHCERKAHFDAGRFVLKNGDKGHQKGWCLYLMGCKGPQTFANCNALRFNDVGVWPVSAGHPCVGCTEKGIAFETSIHKPIKITNAESVLVMDQNLIDTYPAINEKKPEGSGTMLGAAVAGMAIGAVAGFAGVLAAKLPVKTKEESEKNETNKENKS